MSDVFLRGLLSEHMYIKLEFTIQLRYLCLKFIVGNVVYKT